MAITDSFKRAITTGDIRSLRIMMRDNLRLTGFGDFDEMEALAKDVNGLYDEHDGREMNEDSDAWDDAYMNRLMVQVVINFSYYRIEHLKRVTRYLRFKNFKDNLIKCFMNRISF